MVEVGDLFQRLATGGAVTAAELAVIREHMVVVTSLTGAPVERYVCGAKERDGSHCDAELCASNAPYGVCHLRCPRCHRSRTIYYGGYRRANGDLPAARGGVTLATEPPRREEIA